MISDAFNERHNLVRTASVAFLWNHGLFVVNSVIAGLTTYVLARFLKPQDFGIYTSTMAFASLAALLISFGYEGALNVYFPRMRDCTPKLRYLFRQMLWRRFIIVVALFCVLGTYVYFNGGIWLPESLKPISRYLHLAFACGFLTLISGLLTRALITLFRVKPLAVIRVAILSCSLAVYSFLLIRGFGITAILCATIAASGATILLYIFICRDLLIGRAKKVDTNEVYSFGRTTWITDLLGYLLGKNIDIIVMTLYGVSLVHVGFYHIAFSLVAYARMIVNKGMTGVLQSAFSSANPPLW